MVDDSRKANGGWFGRVKDIGEFIFAGILTIYGVAAYYVYREQWRVMQKQTGVMQQQLADARRAAAEADKITQRQLAIAENQGASLRDLAAANRRQLAIAESEAASLRRQAASLHSQAESVKREADAMSSQAASTRTLADANKLIAEAASISAEASKRSACTSAQQLEITDRPWITAALSLPKPVTFLPADPAEGNNGAVMLGPEVTLSNTGRSVANDVRVFLTIGFIGPKSEVIPADAEKRAIETCDVPEVPPLQGKALFPGDRIPEFRELGMNIPEDAIYPRWPESWARSAGRVGKSVQLLLIGCATYKFANSPTVHKTWFTYKIGKRAPPEKQAFQTWSFEIGKTVAARDFFAQKLPHGGNGGD